jgi:hypothetical protein
MFGLLYGLFEQAFAKKEYYALILGLDNAGKTVHHPPSPQNHHSLRRSACADTCCFNGFGQTLLERMKATYGEKEALPPDRIAPTVGLNSTFSAFLPAKLLLHLTPADPRCFLCTVIVGRVDTGRERLVLWDLGGQSGLRSIWPVLHSPLPLPFQLVVADCSHAHRTRQKYYSEASGLLFLLDAADEKRLEEACSAFRTFLGPSSSSPCWRSL